MSSVFPHITLTAAESASLFFSMGVLLLTATTCGKLFEKLCLPKVVGEVLGGVMLGTTLFGNFFPNLYQQVFYGFSGQEKALALLYQLGLYFLMLLTGLHFQEALSNKVKLKPVLLLFFSATALPLLGGYGYYIHSDLSNYMGPNGSKLIMGVIVCAMIAITSIPVIAKIFIDLKMSTTLFSQTVIAAATLQDIVLWAFIGVFLNTGFTSTALFLQGFLILGLFYVVNTFSRKISKFFSMSSANTLLSIVIVSLFIVTSTFSMLGINPIFAALLTGFFFKECFTFKKAEAYTTLKKVSLNIFIPLYFCIVGFKLNLLAHLNMKQILTFGIISTLIEFTCVVLFMRLLVKSLPVLVSFGFAMNARGGPGIVLACLAYEAKFINETFFVTLVLVSLLTSLLAGMWFKVYRNRIEWEKPFTK